MHSWSTIKVTEINRTERVDAGLCFTFYVDFHVRQTTFRKRKGVFTKLD